VFETDWVASLPCAIDELK